MKWSSPYIDELGVKCGISSMKEQFTRSSGVEVNQ